MEPGKKFDTEWKKEFEELYGEATESRESVVGSQESPIIWKQLRNRKMSSDNHIKIFTAADIERYHLGRMSSKEMNALEKAAMDDPFLADALEGYSVAGDNVGSDINELKKKLSQRTNDEKVIPFSSAPVRKNTFLRAAILIAFLAGAALLVYQLGFNSNKNKSGISQNSNAENKSSETKPADSNNVTTATTAPSAGQPAGVESTLVNTGKEAAKPDNNASDEGATKEVTRSFDDLAKNVQQEKSEKPVSKNDKDVASGTVVTPKSESPAPPVGNQPVVSTERGLNDEYKPGKSEDKIKDGKQNAIVQSKKAKNKEQDREEANERGFTMSQPSGANRRDNQQQNYNSNTFRGRVTDATNTGVPFANVTNLNDNNAGTYTDAKGYFNLTYPDSVLNVQVKSIGFENANVQLKNAVPTNQVVLKDDRSNLDEVVLSKQTVNSGARKAADNLKIEEPEPEDGWEKYDTYLVNNLVSPKDAQGRPTTSGTVELSFDVSKDGEPTHIKVEKSLCPACDQEAIRLVKEGPKWKRKAKKGRTSVKISF